MVALGTEPHITVGSHGSADDGKSLTEFSIISAHERLGQPHGTAFKEGGLVKAEMSLFQLVAVILHRNDQFVIRLRNGPRADSGKETAAPGQLKVFRIIRGTVRRHQIGDFVIHDKIRGTAFQAHGPLDGETRSRKRHGKTQRDTIRVKIGQYLELLDTPGTLYPKLDNYDVALNLAFIGSIRDEAVDKNELALELIKKLTKLNKGIEERYGFFPSGDALCDLEKIASVRGFILKGGNVDYDRASNAILDDFRKGRMGKIILE